MNKQSIKEFNAKTNREKFEEFYKYRPFVEKLIYNSSLSNLTYKSVNDIVQEVFCKVWVNIDKYDMNKSSILTYLRMLTSYKIKRNLRDMNVQKRKGYNDTLSIDKKLKGEDRSLVDLLSNNNRDKTEEMENLSLIGDIYDTLSDRECFILDRRFFHHETMRTIGNKLDLCRERIRQILNEIKGKVKHNFKEAV